jgi:hypothetical protein
MVSGGAESEVAPPSIDEGLALRKATLLRRSLVTIMMGLLVGCLIPINAGVLSYYPSLGPLMPILAGIAGLLLFGGSTMIIYSQSQGPKSRKPRGVDSSEVEETNRLQSVASSTPLPSALERTTGLLDSAPAELQNVPPKPPE